MCDEICSGADLYGDTANMRRRKYACRGTSHGSKASDRDLQVVGIDLVDIQPERYISRTVQVVGGG